MREAILEQGKPDSERKSCYDCTHCRAATSWWCTNEQASKWRGTKFPGGIKCPYWEPCRTKADLTRFERWFGDFVYFGKVKE